MPAYMPFGHLNINKVKLINYEDCSKAQKKRIARWTKSKQKYLEDDNRLVRLGAIIDSYEPLKTPKYKNLWSKFAYTDFSKDKNVIAFYESYGPWHQFFPTPGYTTHSESVGELIERQAFFNWLIDLYNYLKSGNDTLLRGKLEHKLSKRYWEIADFLSDDMTPREQAGQIIAFAVEYELKEIHHTFFPIGSRFYPAIGYQVLSQVIYWQFRDIITGGKDLIPCKNPDCNIMFVPEHGKQRWHNEHCKNRYYTKQNYRKSKRKG